MSTCNRLTGSQAYALYKWCEANHDRVGTQGNRAVAMLAEEELGFVVTQTNVGSVQRIADQLRLDAKMPKQSSFQTPLRDVD